MTEAKHSPTLTAPYEVIWLQYCFDHDPCDEPHDDITWCQDKINESDVRYVLATQVRPQRIAQLEAGYDELRTVCNRQQKTMRLLAEALEHWQQRAEEYPEAAQQLDFNPSAILARLQEAQE